MKIVDQPQPGRVWVDRSEGWRRLKVIAVSRTTVVLRNVETGRMSKILLRRFVHSFTQAKR
jgi:hypothetical protein